MKLEKVSLISNLKFVGEGDQTLILCHGYGGSQADWHKLLPYFLQSQNFQVLLFDWNFHSSNCSEDQLSKYSSFAAFADELISLLEQLNLMKGNPSSSDIVFIGHSMSAMIGCIASIKRPQLFGQIIMIGASPRYINSEGYEGGFARGDVDILISNMKSNFQAWADSFLPFIVGINNNDPLLIERFGMSFKSMDPEVALTLAKTIFYSDMRDMLEKVKTPCTIIQTSNDFAVPLFVSHYMQNKMKNCKMCTVEIIDCDGHLPQLTATQKLIEILHNLLGSPGVN